MSLLPTIYVRAKRHRQTIFLSCKSNTPLTELIEQIAALVGKQPADVRLYEVMTAERKQAVLAELEANAQQAAAEALKAAKKKAGKSWIPLPQATPADSKPMEVPPYDSSLRVRDVGLENDSALYFNLRNDDGSWEELPV